MWFTGQCTTSSTFLYLRARYQLYTQQISRISQDVAGPGFLQQYWKQTVQDSMHNSSINWLKYSVLCEVESHNAVLTAVVRLCVQFSETEISTRQANYLLQTGLELCFPLTNPQTLLTVLHPNV